MECVDLRPHTKILVSRDTIINVASLALISAVHSRSLRSVFVISRGTSTKIVVAVATNSFLANPLPAVGRQMLLLLLRCCRRAAHVYKVALSWRHWPSYSSLMRIIPRDISRVPRVPTRKARYANRGYVWSYYPCAEIVALYPARYVGKVNAILRSRSVMYSRFA